MRKLALLFLLLLAVTFCQKKKENMESGAVNQQEQGQLSDSTTLTIKPTPINYDSMFVVLTQIVQSIRENPNDVQLRRNLVNAGYDTTWETIMAVGMSEPLDSSKTDAIATRMAEQAAKADAYRWCAYIKRWAKNPDFNNFGQIQANFSGGRIVKTERLPENRVAVMLELKSDLIQ
ncbi:MAG: hypothetical protein GXO74_13985 [Calditrichaeota bacterium]|nr:hypothetical protein [Calditrichota bacterium]